MKRYFASEEFQQLKAAARKQNEAIEPHEPELHSWLTHAAFLRP